jgi:hypothetical protein
VDGARQEIPSAYVLHDGQVGFQVGAYDASRPLVIDPTVTYSLPFGGPGTWGNGIATLTDPLGNVYAYVTGDDTISATQTNAFVAEVNPAGTGFVYYTTIFAGPGTLVGASGIDVDGAGQVYVAGAAGFTPNTDALAFSLNAAGAFAWSPVYLSGTGSGQAYGVRLDALSNPANPTVYVTGRNSTPGNAFVARLQASTGFLYWNNLPPLGGSSCGYGIGSDQWGNSYVAGSVRVGGLTQAVVFSLNGDPLGTWYGMVTFPSYPDSTSYATAIDVDPAGNAYVTGCLSQGPDGGCDLLLAKVNVYLTTLYNQRWLIPVDGFGIRANAAGDAYVAGDIAPGPSGTTDGWVGRFDFTGTVLRNSFAYPTGPGVDVAYGIALDSAAPNPNAYITGTTWRGPYNTAGFVAKIAGL